ncbi:hypothetical protein Vi05172_g1033 [Venturia inaequalis]|nr:hypothetical protein Vi05172_g1033 [Venturia inaequalis]
MESHQLPPTEGLKDLLATTKFLITKMADPGSDSRGDKKKAHLCIFGNWKGVEATKIFLLDHGLH